MSAKSGGAKKKAGDNNKVVAENRKARYNYSIAETVEAGLELMGSEVKSMRLGRANIAESYAHVKNGEVWLVNAHIPPYEQAAKLANHEPRRIRRLLLHKSEIAKLWNATQRRGMTLVPLKIYFNNRGLAKMLLGLAEGKKVADKRDTEKERSWQRDKARLLRERG